MTVARANPYQEFHGDCVKAAKTWQAQFPDNLQWLNNARALALSDFESISLPTRKTESWKYTPVTPIVQGDFLKLRDKESEKLAEDINQLANQSSLNGLTGDFHVINIVNGHLAPLAAIQDDAVEIIAFATDSLQHQDLIKKHLNKAFTDGKHPFAVFNSSVLQDGILVRIKPDARPARPVCINHLNHGVDQNGSSHARILIVAESGSAATIIENFAAQGPHATMTNALSEIYLADNSKLEHLVINGENDTHIHTGAVFIEQQSGSQFTQHSFATGSHLKRRDIQVKLLGPLADCKLYGTYLIDGKSHVDFHTCLEHVAPHCTSEESFKGIITDRGKAVFNGRIHIHPDAQKSNAQMSNKNLLLTNTAEVDTKPELEIYADDVKCAHGATVGQLDDNALYYCQTRGISKDQANRMLSQAFVEVNIGQIGVDGVKRQVESLTGDFLQQLDRHNQ